MLREAGRACPVRQESDIEILFRTSPQLWSLFSDKPVYLDADPQSDCAILLLFSYPGDHMEARRLICLR